MIESFAASNFRALKDVKLSGLRLVNILVGRSASGKTALLEAIRVGLGGTPGVALALNQSRQPFNFYFPGQQRGLWEGLWGPFFFDFDLKRKISIEITDSLKRIAHLQITFDQNLATIIPAQTGATGPNIGGGVAAVAPLEFRRHTFSGEESTLYASIDPQGQLNMGNGPEMGLASDFFPSTWQANSQQVAGWFSQLSIAKQGDELLHELQIPFPFIEGLSTESPIPGIASIYATMSYRSRKLPVSLISSGINKFLSLLIAIRFFQGGVILVDEIENGIHYSMFPIFWQSLYNFAEKSGTQIFASTHSLECLKAVAPLIDKHSDDFSLVQMHNDKGISNGIVVPGIEAAAAIENDIEVRS